MNAIRQRDHVRFGLVGCGRIAQAHLEALSKVPRARLVAVVEVREAAGRAVAEQNGCPAFADHRDPALPELDAVIICTPPASHHAIARFFLEKGVHVLCEKPLTIRSDDARDLAGLAAAQDRVLMMASKFRYVDDVIKAKAIIESGLLGRVLRFENTFCARVPMDTRWNADPELSGGGVLIDNGSHAVDIARYLLGPLKEVQAQADRFVGLPVEDDARLQFRTASGATGTVDLSWTITKETDYYVTVYGTEGTLQVGWKGSRYRQHGNSHWVAFGSGYDKVAAFRRQLENFVGSIEERERPLITADEALASVQVIEAAYASADEARWMPLGPTRSGAAAGAPA